MNKLFPGVVNNSDRELCNHKLVIKLKYRSQVVKLKWIKRHSDSDDIVDSDDAGCSTILVNVDTTGEAIRVRSERDTLSM